MTSKFRVSNYHKDPQHFIVEPIIESQHEVTKEVIINVQDWWIVEEVLYFFQAKKSNVFKEIVSHRNSLHWTVFNNFCKISILKVAVELAAPNSESRRELGRAMRLL